MEPQVFGDDHTRRKLETVEKYLVAYTTALKKQDFELWYIDACAGSGSSIPRSALTTPTNQNGLGLMEIDDSILDTDQIIVGSAIRALGIDTPFDQYRFNDVKRSNVIALKSHIQTNFPHLEDRVSITRCDANEMLCDMCDQIDWRRSRAVVFIDPFGLQIKYSTLQRLAQTRAVDLWYLAPVFAMYRQIRGDGAVLDDGGKSVDEALGTEEWRHVVAIEEKGQIDLFGRQNVVSKRAVDVAWFEKIVKDRLKLAFDDQVVDEVLPLGRNGQHAFSLMFAWANPSDKAKLAAKLARAVLK
ncbi:MAG: three-Cys-motif partner protein TcmP [Sphingomonadaceae bacterium]|nr:three-Cys-motif partner protein TcmP [Sphingomonadaceae bacterium]